MVQAHFSFNNTPTQQSCKSKENKKISKFEWNMVKFRSAYPWNQLVEYSARITMPQIKTSDSLMTLTVYHLHLLLRVDEARDTKVHKYVREYPSWAQNIMYTLLKIYRSNHCFYDITNPFDIVSNLTLTVSLYIKIILKKISLSCELFSQYNTCMFCAVKYFWLLADVKIFRFKSLLRVMRNILCLPSIGELYCCMLDAYNSCKLGIDVFTETVAGDISL